jgi:hypothetical protein
VKATFSFVMKALFLPLLFAVTAIAQVPPQLKPPAPVRPSTSGAIPSAENTGDLSRFDLDFRGGSPENLIGAISEAMGKKVNVVIGENAEGIRLPAVRVRNATIADVFSAIATTTRHDVAVPVTVGMGGIAQSIQYRTVQSQFLPASNPVTDDTVWSFVSNEAETQELAAHATQPARELRHFQLSDYLNDKLTVADITTAIRTGWEMLEIKNPPDLKFHQETGIMIAAGEAKLIDQIPMVLQQLPRKSGADGDTFPVPNRFQPPTIPGTSTPPAASGSSALPPSPAAPRAAPAPSSRPTNVFRGQ